MTTAIKFITISFNKANRLRNKATENHILPNLGENMHH